VAGFAAGLPIAQVGVGVFLVSVTVRQRGGHIRRSAGMIRSTGVAKALEYRLGPENPPWGKS
jgi:hypothetical protein